MLMNEEPIEDQVHAHSAIYRTKDEVSRGPLRIWATAAEEDDRRSLTNKLTVKTKKPWK